MLTVNKRLRLLTTRALLMCTMLTAPLMALWAQGTNEKFSMTTQMFLNELKEQKEQPTVQRRTPGRQRPDGTLRPKARRLIASPDTVGGVAYISCFIHLKDASDLSAVRALGVEVEETFDGLDFVTARVPVNQLEPLADISNVTCVKVAQQMRPLTDKAREVTNVDDLLTLSNDATAVGVNTKYDGTGVVLGIIDSGIDFQHIAFKDKNGNSRIKRGYIYNGSSATEYTESNISSATTDDSSEDHGTHTATTAGGSSVIVSGSTVTVTDNHANATYGGMAPGADLYLAGIKGFSDTYLTNALKKMVEYADEQGKPLVVSNSWGSGWGPRTGTGSWADLVATYFGDSHPNHIILFAASNDAGHKNGNEGGGFFVKKSAASSSSPLGTIIRTDDDGGDYYTGLIACAWNASNATKLNCKIHVLNSSGTILKTWEVTSNSTTSFSGLSTYYTGSMAVYIEQENGKYRLALYSEEGIQTTSSGKYTLAIEVYPSSGNANINMWSGDWSFFTDNYTTTGHTWLDGTDDMCVSDEATIPNAISVGAYVSKKTWKDYSGSSRTSNVYTVGDIAYFSSYATAEQSPTGLAYPWISAPGARLAAGVNHNHTTSVDNYSYYGSKYNKDLVVNNSSYPYAMMEGTSMATPVAAGIVALWLQAAQDVNQDLTVNDVKNIMEQTAIKDSYVTTGANASHFGKGKIDALAGIQYILASGGPTIRATPSSINFGSNGYATHSYTQTLNVKGFNLEGGITATLTDANGVYSLSQTSITQSAAADGVDITITYAPQAAGTHNATITLTSSNATSVEVPVTATAKAATPIIIADPETLTFTAGLSEQKSLTFDVLTEFLTGNVTVTLSDANNVFSIDMTSITKADSEEGATVTVTFQSATAGTFNGTVTLRSAGAEDVVISLTGTAKDSSSNPNTTTFKLVSSTDDLEEDMRYIIGCGSQSKAAGAIGSGTFLSDVEITLSSDVITINNNVAVFILEQTNDGWTFKNESSNEYLQSTTNKNVSYSSTASAWTLSNGTAGVIMTAGSAGTMLYNVNSPRFTTYTSNPSASMIQANLYMEYDDGSTPVVKQDVTMSFSPATATAIIGEDFMEPTLSTTPDGLTVTYSSSDSGVATVNENSGEVTLVAAGTTTITATFEGNDSYNEGSASYTLTVNAAQALPSAPTGLTLSDVTATSMTASWTAVVDATSYDIDVVQSSSFEASAGNPVLESDFSDTSGWTLSGTGTYTGAGYYGASSPSIKFDGTGDYAISPDFGSGVKLQFWALGNGGPGSTFKISGLVNDFWTDIETVTIGQGAATYEVNIPAGTSQVRFDFTKSVNCGLDDVVVYSASNNPISLDGYPKSVGSVTSTAITGLTAETQYAVRVRAMNGAGGGEWSSTVTATTPVAYSAPVWSAFPTNTSTTLGGEDIELTISDYVTGVPTPTITLATTTANSDDYDFDPNDGYFYFCPSVTGTFSFTFTATNSVGSANATLTITVSAAPITVPTLAVTEAEITSTSVPVTWIACDNVTAYTLQLARDDQFTNNTAGGQVTLFSNNATSTTAPQNWTYNISNSSSSYLILFKDHYVVTKAVDASNCTSLSLSYKQRTYGGTSGNSNVVLVQYSTDNGTSWSDLGSTQATTTTLTTKSLDVSAAAGMSSVRFRLSVPEATVSRGCGISTIVLTGTESANDGSLISTATISSTDYTFTGLTPATTYYARVRGNVDWSNVISFTTNSVLSLANKADNTDAISAAATSGKKYDVTLAGRTLYRDGAWNTLCLPFDVTIADSPLAGADVRALSAASLENDVLTLNFTETNEITEMTAGTPYIIKWANSGNNITEPVFTAVTISDEKNDFTSLDGKVHFLGTYNSRTFDTDVQSILFMGESNTLYYPKSGATIGAQRAYFQLSENANVKEFVLNFGDDIATGIQLLDDGSFINQYGVGAWYDLSGRQIIPRAEPVEVLRILPRRVYIHNGRKIIIK